MNMKNMKSKAFIHFLKNYEEAGNELENSVDEYEKRSVGCYYFLKNI